MSEPEPGKPFVWHGLTLEWNPRDGLHKRHEFSHPEWRYCGDRLILNYHGREEEYRATCCGHWGDRQGRAGDALSCAMAVAAKNSSQVQSTFDAIEGEA